MRRFSFGTFLVDDANRALYETCRSIASLSYRGRLPVLLVAPEGYGKTHLLYSIVNRARSGPDKTGVAFVSAENFPTEVRRLTRNPRPVERARNAILLVDDLDRFHDRLDDLDRLVDLFLKHGHYVVLTSAAALSSLTHLPAPLQRRLERGHAFEIQAPGNGAQVKPESQPSAPASPALEQEVQHLRRQCETVQQELSHARQEIEQLRGENALLKVSAREVGPLREKLEALQDQIDHASPEPPAPPEDSPARQQAGEVLEKAAALLEEVQQSRSRLAQIREQSRLFDLAHPPIASEPPTEPPEPAVDPSADAALEEVEAERDRLREERDSLQREIDTLRRSVARANEERDETRRHLRAAYEKLDRHEKSLAELRERLEEATGATESAVEEQIKARTGAARLDASAMSDGLRDVQAQFAAGLRLIDRMADRLDALCAALGGSDAQETDTAENETFFVTPADDAPSKPEAQEPEEQPAFVPGIGAQVEASEEAEASALERAAEERWNRRRTLHHIEELSEPGLFSYPDEPDSSI